MRRPRPQRLGAVALALTLATFAPALASAAGSPAFTAPSRLFFAGGDDWEPAIAADSYGHVYVATSHYVGYGGGSAGDPDPSCLTCASPHTVLQVSSDGGRTFGAPRALSPSTERQDDPQIVVDPADGRTVYAAFMQANKSSQYVARSDDFGVTWRAVLVEPLQRGTDKDILAVRGSDLYLAYHTQQKIFVSVSHDGGATWSLQNVVGTTNSSLGVSLPSGGAVDSQGRVFFAWNGVERPGQAKGSINLYVTRSSDGGATWTTSRVDVSGAPPDCSCAGWDYLGAQMALAVDANDTVDVLWNASRTDGGPQRMYFARSTDHGSSWSSSRQVSNAPLGTDHAFPAIVARGAGDVRVAWMDDRNGFDSGSSPDARWNVWYRESADGGTTWSPETQLSAPSTAYGYSLSTPKDGFLSPYGDYFEMDISGGKTVAAWGEGYSYAGPGNIWFASER